MNKRIILTITVILSIFIFCICSVGAVIVWGGVSFWDNAMNWSQDNEKWQEVEIPINNYEGKVIFMAQAAHPFLAEYNYKLKISDQENIKTIDLPINTGGQIDETINYIEFNNKKYIEIRGTLIDLAKKEAININESTYSNHKNDKEFYEIRIKGLKKFIGRVYSDHGLKFSDKADSKAIIEEENKIIWDAWKELPSKKGQIRAGVNKSSEDDFIIAYFEISNDKEQKIFTINTPFDVYEFEVKEYLLDGYSYIVLGDQINQVFSTDALIKIENSGVVFSTNTKSKISSVETSDLWIESLYLSEIIKNNNVTEIGLIKYLAQKAELTSKGN